MSAERHKEITVQAENVIKVTKSVPLLYGQQKLRAFNTWDNHVCKAGYFPKGYCTSEKHVRHSLPFLYYVLMVLANSDSCTRRGTGAAPLYCSLANTLI